MKKYFPWIVAIAAVVLMLGAAAVLPAHAQDEGPLPTPSDNEVNAIAKNMFCPVCENTPLDVCGTQACAQWREQIRDKLALGWTEQEIYDYFVQLYGDRVLAEPPKRGFNWLVYILPPVAFLAGVFILYRGFQSWKKPVAELEEEGANTAQQDEYISRLEEELKNRN
jgi:cytochrome c-type biogenesis protein CcmH